MKNLGKLLFTAAFAAGVMFAQGDNPAKDADTAKAANECCCGKSCKMAKKGKKAETAKTEPGKANDAKGCGDCCKAH